MKKALLFLISILFTFLVEAFHIVGGEIEFITIEPGTYRINLIQYRDEAQNENNFYEESVTVYIFSNKTNTLVSVHALDRVSISDVFYTKEECSIESLQTSKVLFSAQIQLNPQDYADEEGYYVVWERCCRNVTIKNIVNPRFTGMKYIVEIPPLWKNGAPFINSTPELLKPLSDYACIDQLYYTNFTGTDRDGDSLVYKLATPLNSSTDEALPIPQPKPNINATFQPGYSVNNMVPGNPSLRISNRGLLTVSPEETGLYVFSVIVEEWRDQEKIGEVQRDFQMLVIGGCNPPDPPDVGIKIPGDDQFNPEVDTLKYTLVEDKCFEFIITNITAGETISLRAEPVNFVGDVNDIFSINDIFVGPGRDTLKVEVCAPGCPPVRNGPFIIDLIAGDDACPLPQLDTARLMIEVEPPPNEFPQLNGLQPGYTVNEDTFFSVALSSIDADNDSIAPNLIVAGYEDPSEFGFSISTTLTESGKFEGFFNWDTDCQVYDFTAQQNFSVGIQMEDYDICEVTNPNVVWLNMNVILPPNTSPEVSSSSVTQISTGIDQPIGFTVFAEDLDQDTLSLRLVNPEPGLSISFNDTTNTGEVSSEFLWEVDCDALNFESSQTYDFYFIAEDKDKCEVTNADTLTVSIEISVPPNDAPEFFFYPDTTLEVNTPFEMEIVATDPNLGDTLQLEFFNAARNPRSESLIFEPAIGVGKVSSIFSWTPECSLLDFGETSTDIELIFLVFDNGCPISKLDTMAINFTIQETRDEFMNFLPPNAFSPNGDGKNDTFTLSGLPKPSQNLPPDNCDDAFQYISINDRNGNEIFRSENREFSWDGRNAEAGTYFYVVKYSRTSYNGYIQLLR